MAAKTKNKTGNKTDNSVEENCIPGLTNSQAYHLVNALEGAHCGHVGRVYITTNGYFFSQGNDLHEMVDLDPAIPTEAALLRVGKKQKKVLLPGKYIGRKQVIKEYTREEILEKREEVLAAYAAEQKELKAKQKAMNDELFTDN